ncbi:exonuclease domain-containing protein [Litoribrevibacter albus]|uniref:DNA-directed DNA polymerase n=1 Tax=Litoribrevibacter albus TaxID=1473156 RepID=A0AA37W8R6_9GAMM|nr:exonuclease domain-containing protein [Litoribrevibacter albus]GLQ32309.1 hypothetical protein GCM10007876_27880 [Litoribrevibacter albus]
MKQELPEKYYLDHFYEFIDYISSVSGHLLEQSHQTFLNAFRELDEASQCLLVRLLNRNVSVIDQKTLRYAEIYDLESSLSHLNAKGLIRSLSEQDWPGCLTYFTKDQLCAYLDQHQIVYKSSFKKQAIIEVLVQSITFEQMNSNEAFKGYWIKACESDFHYLLYLFFGNVDSRLNQFSLRDLGVRKTQGQQVSVQARFNSKEEAATSFIYAQKLHALKKPQLLDWEALANEVAALPEPVGETATVQYSRYLLKLARQVERLDEQRALSLYQLCSLPEAEERCLRLLYSFGEREQVQQRLMTIIERAGSEHLLLFAEDFLARKFNQKRTSKLTDVLRSAKQVNIDEMFRHNVEQGVCNYYRSMGIEAIHTENDYWRALFGLTFWSELFESELSICNEFDWTPACLKDGRFYSLHEIAIQQKLSLLADKSRYLHFLTQCATEHFGKPNGLFRWKPTLLKEMLHILKPIDLDALRCFLEVMAQNYQALSDGFPDLTVIDEQGIRFEEVKAPGDSLRQNQLVTLNKLKEAGFDAGVCRVNWITDPDQAYCVVDIETTGGTKETHRITEIGIVKVIAGEIVDRWQTLVNPQRHIPGFITNLTGISDDMVKDSPTFAEIAGDLTAFLAGSIFVAHNVNFDYGFIKAEFARLDEHFSMPKLCTVKEMRRFYPGHDSYGLANLCEIYDIRLINHHRALSDAEATAQLLLMINEKRLTNVQVDR